MREFLEILLAGSLMLVACVVLLARRRALKLTGREERERELLALVRRDLKLSLAPAAGQDAGSITGFIDNFHVEVTVDPESLNNEVASFNVSIAGGGRIPSEVSFTPRAITLNPKFSPPSRTVPGAPPPLSFSGQYTFESRVEVSGHELTARAALNESTRMLVMNVVGRLGAWVDRGSLGWSASDAVRVPLNVVIRQMLELARALSFAPENIPERLRKIALEDEHPAVRAVCLSRLVERFPGSEPALRACEDGLRDGDASVRLLAAKHRGEPGLALIRDIARSEAISHETRVEALRHLLRFAPNDAVEPLLGALRSRSKRTQSSALAIISDLPFGLVAADRLVDALTEAQFLRPETAEAGAAITLARTLGRTRSPRAEATLLALLAREDLAVKVVAAEALGAIGSAGAVERLLRYTKGVLLDPHLKGIARAAIGEIQARLAGAESGHLSLIEDHPEERGNLSMDPGQGALTVVNKE